MAECLPTVLAPKKAAAFEVPEIVISENRSERLALQGKLNVFLYTNSEEFVMPWSKSGALQAITVVLALVKDASRRRK